MRFIQCDTCLTMRKWGHEELPPGWRKRKTTGDECGPCILADEPEVANPLFPPLKHGPQPRAEWFTVKIEYGGKE